MATPINTVGVLAALQFAQSTYGQLPIPNNPSGIKLISTGYNLRVVLPVVPTSCPTNYLTVIDAVGFNRPGGGGGGGTVGYAI